MVIQELPTEQRSLLRQGERLTALEFRGRYLRMPALKKAELIQGIVSMPSPVRFTQHAQPHASIVGWLGVYTATRSNVGLGNNGTVRLDDQNEFQPDAFLVLNEEQGGQTRVDEDGYVVGPPEFVAEISGSTLDQDVGIKRDVYQQSGVREYLLWDVMANRIDWWILVNGQYELLPTDANGVIHSRTFPGLCLHVPAMLAGESATVIATLQQGIANRS